MYFYDVSALITLGPQAAMSEFATSITCLYDLEDIRNNDPNQARRTKAAQALAAIRAHKDMVNICSSSEACGDDYYPLGFDEYSILQDARHVADKTEIIYVTSNLAAQIIASKKYNLLTMSVDDLPFRRPKDYKGWQDINMKEGGDKLLASIYNHEPTPPGAKTNEYLVVRNDDNSEADLFRFDGSQYAPLRYTYVKSRTLGQIMPRNTYQKFAFDLLQNNSITVKLLLGVFGSGKDHLMISHAVNMVERGMYDKIVWVRNNIEVKDSKPLGFLPGGPDSKLLPFAGPLVDHLGGEVVLDEWLAKEKLELQHLGFIRGRDIKKAIIICSEAENMTKEHIQLLLGRVGEGSTLWINGDMRQIDHHVFKANSGIASMVERLAGRPEFGYVFLPITERSRTAALADLLD